MKGYRRNGAFLIAVGSLMLVSCSQKGPDPAPAASNPPSNTVAVDVTEWAVRSGSESAPPGRIIFEVTNVGDEQHNFSVLKTDLDPSALPVTSGGGANVTVEEIEVVGFLPTFGSQDTVDLTVDVAEGDYVLICNLVDHYSKGMATAFTVQD